MKMNLLHCTMFYTTAMTILKLFGFQSISWLLVISPLLLMICLIIFSAVYLTILFSKNDIERIQKILEEVKSNKINISPTKVLKKLFSKKK